MEKEIHKIFKEESVKVFELIYSLKEQPLKGKFLTQIGGIVLKELKYKVFRIYFIQKGNTIKCYKQEELQSQLLKFIRISKKDSQQKTIDEIKEFLRRGGFNQV